MRLIPVLGSLVLALSTGCVGAEDTAIDGEGDRYIVDGKADTGGIQEGTAEAAAVLHVASTFSRADLVGEVGLAAKAADNVLAYRSGDDGAVSTSDDETFETLAELDAIPFIGPIAFGKLLAYAQAADLVGDVPVAGPNEDAFDPASCQGANLSMATANQWWSTNQGRLGTYQLQIRKRTCTGTAASTCGAYEPVSLASVDWRQDASGILELRKYGGEVRLVVEARTCTESSYYGSSPGQLVGTSCDGIGHDLYCYDYAISPRCGYPSDPPDRLDLGGQWITFAGKLTENCVRLASTKSTSLFNGTRTEYETAILERF